MRPAMILPSIGRFKHRPPPEASGRETQEQRDPRGKTSIVQVKFPARASSARLMAPCPALGIILPPWSPSMRAVLARGGLVRI
jgi:hypothetical protein